METSASKNKSSYPANGLFGRRAPLAIVWIQPNDSVHHEMIRLVSLNFRFRNRMAAVLSIPEQSNTRTIEALQCASRVVLIVAHSTRFAPSG
jgi:hypothetical protein